MARSSSCRWERLFFTKNEDLDLGYVFLIPFLILALVGWIMAATGHWTVTVAMWSFLGSLIATLILATVPIARARILKDASLPGSIAQGIATAGNGIACAETMVDRSGDGGFDGDDN